MMSSPAPTLFDSSPIDAQTFLAEYWQQKPLLIRQALPGAEARIDPEQLFALAKSKDVESRLVTQSDGSWRVIEGPFNLGTSVHTSRVNQYSFRRLTFGAPKSPN